MALFQVDEAVRFIQQQEKELKKYLAETPSTDAASIKFKRWVAEHRIASHKSSIVSLIGSLRQAFFVLYG